MQVRLEVVRGAKTKEIILRLPSVIGRGGDAKIKLPASTVSRHHCEIYEYDGQIAVRDLASSNGTIVNGHKIKGPTFLTPEDELTIGPLTARLHPHIQPKGVEAAPIVTAPTTHEDQPTDSSEPLAEIPVIATEEEVAPTFDELPMEEVEPIGATEALDEIEVIEEVADEEDSVLQYTEPNENAGRSFVGIATANDAPDNVSNAPVFDGVEQEDEQVRSDDTSLNDFFKKLDG